MELKKSITTEDWNRSKSIELYGIKRWGLNYFDINKNGDMTVAPMKDKGPTLCIMDITQQVEKQGLSTPLLLRFPDLLHHRVAQINNAFINAINEFQYKSIYRGVYPIKVNHLREVVEEILHAANVFHYGLEVGSKPELFAAMALHEDRESLIICNGYKDNIFISTALNGIKLGKKIILVAEKISELRKIITLSKQMDVEPLIGIRIKLTSKGIGKWQDSSGEESKFGFSTPDIIKASNLLKNTNMAHCLKLLHFHIGSQVPDILAIKKATREGAMYYSKLKKMGHDLEFLDVGGGLGIDYDGSRSTFHSSTNYSLDEYARDIVYNIMDICDMEQVAHPIIVNESGRATVSHHSVLVVQVLDQITKIPETTDFCKPNINHKLLQDAWYVYNNIQNDNPLETYHDALQLKQEAFTHFELGLIDLEIKAGVENLFWLTANLILQYYKEKTHMPDEIRKLEKRLTSQYLCNFSIFQSLLDHWGINQLFPIAPLHRLNEEPTQRGILTDITCDSDGKIANFISMQEGSSRFLHLHDIDSKPYFLGFFLTAAYQDVIGDIHNLFGKVNEAHIFLDDNEEQGYYIEETIKGTSIESVLEMVQYTDIELTRRMKKQVDKEIKDKRLKANVAMQILKDYEKNLKGYTYLNI